MRNNLDAWTKTEINNCPNGRAVRAPDLCPEGPAFEPSRRPGWAERVRSMLTCGVFFVSYGHVNPNPTNIRI